MVLLKISEKRQQAIERIIAKKTNVHYNHQQDTRSSLTRCSSSGIMIAHNWLRSSNFVCHVEDANFGLENPRNLCTHHDKHQIHCLLIVSPMSCYTYTLKKTTITPQQKWFARHAYQNHFTRCIICIWSLIHTIKILRIINR